MKLLSITDERFKKYGEVINDDFSDILEVLKTRPCPSDHAMYVASDPELEACPSFEKIQNDYFGRMPIQIGHCSGHNNKLTCLEYHKCSEINMANEDFVLLVGERKDIVDGIGNVGNDILNTGEDIIDDVTGNNRNNDRVNTTTNNSITEGKK